MYNNSFLEDYIKDFEDFLKNLPELKKQDDVPKLMSEFLNIFEHLDDEESDPFQKEEKRIAKLSLDEFESEARVLSAKIDSKSFQFIEHSITILVGETAKNISVMASRNSTSDISENYSLKKIEALRLIVSSLGEPYKTTYFSHLKLLEDWHKVLALGNDSEDSMGINFRNNFKAFLRSPLVQRYSMISKMHISKFEDESFELPIMLNPPPNKEWWRSEFLDWAFYTMMQLSTMCKRKENCTINDIENTGDITKLMRDKNGQGRVFVPGLSMLAILTENSNSTFHKRIYTQLENILKVPYRKVIDTKSVE